MLYMVTFTINTPPMLAYIPYMDPIGNVRPKVVWSGLGIVKMGYKHYVFM